ncbi:unnamed protein product, partial [Brenthis ino]
MKPRTLGQWFLMLLLERVRRRVSEGVGLRTLLYCVCWCSRLVQEHDYERLRASATMIKAWLLQNTCQDCVYKKTREVHAAARFTLRGWNANKKEVIGDVPAQLRATSPTRLGGDGPENKILGLHRDAERDELGFNISMNRVPADPSAY